MRNLCLACLCVLAAVLWSSACCRSDKVCTATNTINAATLVVQETEVSAKKLVKERLLTAAAEERDQRTAALAKAGCPLDPAQAATEPCKLIVATAQGHYEGRKANIVSAATKIDASTGLAYAALLTAIDVLIVVRDGAKDKWPELERLIAEAVKVGRALADAWADLKLKIPTY